MIDCPKCGFNQPKDQYCANCGVNMLSYQAKPLPFLKSLWSKSITQSSLFVVLVISLVAIIFFGNFKNKIVKTFSNESKYEVSDTEEDFVDDEVSEEEEEESISLSTAQKTVPTKAKLIAAPPTTTAYQAITPRRLKLSFYEASSEFIRNDLRENLSEGIKVSKLENIENFSDFLKANSTKLHTLSGSSTNLLELNKTIFLDHKLNDENTGLIIEIKPTAINSQLLSLTISGQINLPNGPNTINNFDFDTQIDIKPSETAYLINFILPEQISQETLSQVTGSPLAIFESQDFIQANSAVILFLEPSP